MKLEESLEILKKTGHKVLSEKKLPKYKQRQTAIDATFEKIGISGEEYIDEFNKLFESYVNPLVLTYGALRDKYNPYHSVEFVIYQDESKIGDRDVGSAPDEGEIRGRVSVTPAFDRSCLLVETSIIEYGKAKYSPYRSQKRNTLFSDSAEIPVSADPAGDFKKCLDYVDATMKKMDPVASRRASEIEDRAARRGQFSWADVRSYIDEETMWDIEEADREGFTGYLVLGKRVPFAVYGPSGKLKVCTDASAWLRNSFRFSKMKLFWYGAISRKEIEAANAELEDAKDSEDIGRILCNLNP